MENSNLLHWNRDENSFTARLFEGILFPKFKKSNDAFSEFLNVISLESARNFDCIKKRFPDSNTTSLSKDKEFVFLDGMLFLECVDVYSYIKNEFSKGRESELSDKISRLFPNGYIDKTEFDCVILCKDKEGKKLLIVFEVKCYSDLDSKEINRQHEWLEKFKEIGLFDDYYHFGLISYDNFKNAIKIFKSLNYERFSILTWEDFKQYVTESDRFSYQDLQLNNIVHKNGKRENKRYLLKRAEAYRCRYYKVCNQLD
jgi:hypothetical protein